MTEKVRLFLYGIRAIRSRLDAPPETAKLAALRQTGFFRGAQPLTSLVLPVLWLFLGSACALQSAAVPEPTPAQFSLQQFQELRWLEGTWRGAAAGEDPFFERYRFVNDSTIEITYYADSTLTATTGTGSVMRRAGRILHQWENSHWAATAMEGNAIHFAPIENASNDFTWARETADAWVATLREPGSQTTVYRLERIGTSGGSGTVSRSVQRTEEHAAVERAVLDYVEGFYEGDSAKLARSVWPQVQKYGYWRDDPDSPYSAGALPFAEFMRIAESVRAEGNQAPADAPQEIIIFDVQDQTASAKLTASWGTDYLLLAKENGRWMITHVLWQSHPPTAQAPRNLGTQHQDP